MKKHQFGLSLCLTFLLVVSACDMPPISNMRLFVGQADGVTAEKMMIVDGQGQEARFSGIRQLEVDSVGNLYVYDSSSEIKYSTDKIRYTSDSIRKVTPDGNVSTLITSDNEVSLMDGGSLTIHEDALYLGSAGCLLKSSLNEEEFQLQTIYGRCLSKQEFIELSNSNNEQKSSLAFRFYSRPITPHNTIFYRFSNMGSPGTSMYLKVLPTGNVETIDFSDYRKSGFSFIDSGLFDSRYDMDSTGRIYGLQYGDPGPGIAGDNSAVRIKSIDSPDESEVIYKNQLKSPQYRFLTLDNQDNLYVIDQNIFKRVSPQGQVQNLALLQDPNDEDLKNFGIQGEVVNPQRTWLYFATATAIYQIPLPPTTTP